MPDDLATLSLAEISRRIHAGEVSSRDVTQVILERIERLNPSINAFITILAEEALHEAGGADHLLKAEHDLGSLHGVPLAVKDLFATRGVRTTAGSKILADWTPEADATAVMRLRQAGAIILGKLNMDEFAFGGTTENAHYGPTRNPWDLERSPGGSSGGSAAAVAASMAYAALGTDTAASVRNPAHFCGIVGFKPTYGRVSLTGVVPLAWSMDHVGPLARTVEDAALVLQAIAGHDPKDGTSSQRPVPDYTAHLDDPIDGLRIGVLRGYFWEPIQPAIDRAVETAIDTLRSLGAQVRNVELPLADDLFPALFNTLLPAEAAAYHQRWLNERPNDYGPAILDRLLPGAAVPAVDYVNAQRARSIIQDETRELMRSVDLLVMPTVPYTAARLGQIMVEVGDGEMEASTARTRNLFPFNVLGLPALSVPCGFDDHGLPIGMQIVGRAFDEETVLRAGHAYQKATDWHTKRPPDDQAP